ncbi:beta-mannosidase-like, partial [Diaphorina citri]|uniref:beta-mannosidase n=1 Tax=Diaphorina citri TaxID=121845 RepID=A0A3Q0JMA5_DIACI
MVPASEVELWWPNGYGEQPLYNLQITLASGVEMSTKSIKIGFRTVELIQDHVDPNHLEKGRYFYFEVNKVPIYSKGSNLIPVDILPERSNNESTIRDLLVSTKEANMNMLRVWGGGVYMSDYFYETCDELGILIWQDMMFACNNYPATPTFLQSVRSEISQTVRRVQHHPCIAVWAGNNEMEGATIQKWYIRENPELYYKEYAELYVNTLKPIVLQYDPTRPYLTSSPTNGIESEKAKYALADNPYSNIYGDTHNYDYYQNLWDPSTAPKSRFCSEFGIQSLPQLSTFQKVATEADLASWRTPFFDSRQHLAGGTGILESSVGHQFEIGNLTLEYFAYLSQIYQAGAIKTITEQMRRDKGVLREDGSGHNMGALYWQLNDVWQAPTWSSIAKTHNIGALYWQLNDMCGKPLPGPLVTCDELGILIWQDMMFACNNYPATPTFLQSVRSEISQTVRRVQHHPCIAVWAGNNEMEGATIQKWYIRENPELYYKEYAELYVNTLKPIVLQYDPTRPYLTSSPTNGIESEKAKYALADNPYSNIYGD